MNTIYDIRKSSDYTKAGPDDLIGLIPVGKNNQIIMAKKIIETLVVGIVKKAFIHISGPSGVAKSAVIQALTRQPKNFELICRYLGLKFKPIHCKEIETAIFDTSSELTHRRSLNEKGTFDEPSILVQAFKLAERKSISHYCVIHLREIGRVHNASIQGGLISYLNRSDTYLPDGTKIKGDCCAVLADSNYTAIDDGIFSLVELDDALRRRFTINLCLNYYSEAYEASILAKLVQNEFGIDKVDTQLISKICRLGNQVRQLRSDGNLRSAVPPTIYGYIECYRFTKLMQQLPIHDVIMTTMLGNLSKEDIPMAYSLIQSVFQIRKAPVKETVFDDVF